MPRKRQTTKSKIVKAAWNFSIKRISRNDNR